MPAPGTPGTSDSHAATDATAVLRETQIQLRVRYAECDPQNVAHHANYAVWLEAARTELLREQGCAYRDLEAQGIFFVVARMSMRFHTPARYDDELTIAVRLAGKITGNVTVKVEHEYSVHRGNVVLATAQTTLVCVDAAGSPRPVPEMLMR